MKSFATGNSDYGPRAGSRDLSWKENHLLEGYFFYWEDSGTLPQNSYKPYRTYKKLHSKGNHISFAHGHTDILSL